MSVATETGHRGGLLKLVGGGQEVAVPREDQPSNKIGPGPGEEPRSGWLYIPQHHFAAPTSESGQSASRSHSGNRRVGEGKRMVFSFGETQRVPHAESLIGVNDEQ